MIGYVHILSVALAGSCMITLLVVMLERFCCQNRRSDDSTGRKPENMQTGIQKLHQSNSDLKGRGNGLSNRLYSLRGGPTKPPLFNWADHPLLVTDAVENGWSRFGFIHYDTEKNKNSMLSPTSLLGLCSVTDDSETKSDSVDISWEVFQGSSEFMQKIRLNPGLKLSKGSVSVPTAIKSALPLPGPAAFPQEAYFEITILYFNGDLQEVEHEGESDKLIEDYVPRSESYVNGRREFSPVTSKNYDDDDDHLHHHGENTEFLVSLGLTAAGSGGGGGGGGGGDFLPLKPPGSYRGSIGFNSDASIYLDGTKLEFESEKRDWGKSGKVIGCGFDPKQKKVFFTVDSKLIHEINCDSEEFGSPLFPTITAYNDVMVLVNFGQSAFDYAPANVQRTVNPCFVRPVANSSTVDIDYEDSKEFFSMGVIDAQWRYRVPKTTNNTISNSILSREVDAESDTDMFEIAIDNGGKSPSDISR